MSEHTYAQGSSPDHAVHETPTFAATAESIRVCDTRCQTDPRCQISQGCDLQHSSIPCTDDQCVSDHRAGCQRSTPGSPSSCCGPTSSCLDLAHDSCCQDDSDARNPDCQDGCCPGPIPSCDLDTPGVECDQGDCCLDCASGSPSECGQNDTDAHSLATKDDSVPRNRPECCQACPIGTVGLTAETEDNIVVSARVDGDGPGDYRCKCRRHLAKIRNTICCSERMIFGRFFRPTGPRSHTGNSRPDAKTQNKTTTRPPCPCYPVPEKDHRQIATEGAAKPGDDRIQTLLLTVDGMDCPSCALKLKKAFSSLPSVQDAKVNVFTGRASLKYNEDLISPSKIAKRATRLSGFTCSVDDEPRLEGKYRVLRIKFQANAGLPLQYPVLPLGVVILKTSRTESSVVFDVQYDAALIQPRPVLDIFVPLGGSFLPPPVLTTTPQDITSIFRRTLISAILSIPVVVFSWAPLRPHPITYGAISLFLATCIQVYVAAPLYSSAFYTLTLQHDIDMDVLVAFSSTIAYVFSLVAYIMQVAGHEFSTPFFETPTLLLTLITLGNLISAYSRRRATSVLDNLGSLQPNFVRMVLADDTATAVTHVDLIQSHDVLRVSSNALIPTDGIVLRGLTQVDESALTGESLPVDKAPGSPLTAGTRNVTCSIDMEVSRAPAENTLAEFASLVTRLQETRLPVQDIADRAASLLAPVILSLGVITFVIWMIIGLHVRGEHFGKAGLAALRYSISVLVISCPCAVVLCVPMVIIITGAVGIREGVLFKTAIAVQNAKNATVVVFDKTGTLTLGHMGVVEAYVMHEDAIGTILALVSQDLHPVAHAVTKYLLATYPNISAVSSTGQVQSFPGKGLEMTINNVLVRGGNPNWLGLQTEPHYSLMMHKALTMFAVTIDSKVVAFFGLADSSRSSAAAAVEILEHQGVQVHIVSGDARPVVGALAKQLGIPSERAVGGCLPAEKVAYIRALQATGACVMFIGDGTNDTPALAAADVSVAMSSGTDIARSAADVVFLAPDLARALSALFRLSRGAAFRIYLNFVWAVIYNLSAVLFAAGAFVKVRIAPEYAALGEMVSVVPVVLVAWSMWLLKF